jgi:hypothetical protein
VRYANSDAVDGWRDLCGKAPANTRRAYETLRSDPKPVQPTTRHHQLKRDLAFVIRDGVRMEHWQYEVTGGGRIWYHVDEGKRTVWLDRVGVGHPKATD